MTKAAELAKMGEILTNSQIGGRRNIVINGAMQVAQRATSATGVGGTNEEYPTIDRFNFTTTSAGRFTMSQEADGPDGFANSMKLACTTADTSISSTEALILQTKFEGQDVQRLMYGSSSAQPITVSFYVKGNASATYTLEWRNEEDGRNIGKTFNVTTDWTRVSITFTGDTAGSAVDDDNTHAFTLGIWLHGGSYFSGGTFAENTWHATNNLRIGDGQTSFLDSTNRTFFITGVQLEIGSQATPFEHRSYGEELTLCQRYYHRHVSDGSSQNMFGVGFIDGTTNAAVQIHFPTTMRDQPSALETTGTAGNYAVRQRAGSVVTCSSVPTMSGDTTPNVAIVSFGTAGSLTSDSGCMGRAVSSGVHLSFTAEL
jgi:hypothetical protein